MNASYKNLIAWQKSMTLVKSVYDVTKCFPRQEMFGLTNQLRRAAISIPSNIAEGQGRLSKKDFVHFLAVARGSLLEVETQLLISHDLNYIKEQQLKPLIMQVEEIGRILNGLIVSMRRQSAAEQPASRQTETPVLRRKAPTVSAEA